VTIGYPGPFSRRGFLRTMSGALAAALLPRRAGARTAAPEAASGVSFTDVTGPAGLLRAVNVSGSPGDKQFLLEEMGGGAAFFDYDNDGWLDIFLVNGTTFDSAVRDRPRSYLFHNNRDGTFTDVTEKSGLLHSGWGQGCCVGDYDNDGHDDLFVTYWGKSVLYHNNGDGTFADVSESSGIARPRGPSSMVFVPSNWQPTGSYGMGAAVADFDNDGWPDIYVASDTAPSLLYRNNHDGTFREIAGPAGCAFDGEGAALAGMGVGVGDFDADGWLDIVRTNFSEQVTTLYRNYGGGAFEDASLRAGLGVNRKYLGFGVDFLDFDNDGWADIFIANGHVYSQIANRKLHLKYREPKVLYRNLGNGRFEDVSAKAGPAILAENLGRGCAFGDFDNDGDVDVLVNNLDGPPTLLRNEGGSGNGSILVKCVGTKSNRSAIGARVRVSLGGHVQMREVMSGGSYYSQSDLRLHFGLGRAAAADSLEVSWPSGLKETFKDVPANHLFVVQETKGVVEKRRLG
jgi:hypothetical protein